MITEFGIDLVVCNYRTPGDLESFCESLFEHQPSVPWTLTVVNVSPLDKDMAIGEWATQQNKQTRHMYFKDNIGYARACNAASINGTHEILALFNADVRLTAGSIDECYRALEGHPGWGILGPRQIDDRGFTTHAGIFGTHASPQHRAWQQPDSPLYADVREAVTVSGAAYFIRRKLWNELTACRLYRNVAPDAEGAFLPTPHYYDETWCSYHAWAHGWKVFYYGPVCIVHKWHQASAVGGVADQQFPISQAYFRRACDAHDISHD